MSTRSGKTTKRTMVDSYKGFSIIKVNITYWWKPSYCKYYTNIPDRKERHFEFCKEGEDNRPSQAYNVNTKDIAECKECIDKFLEDDTLYFTEAEREKYIYKPNRKNDWGFNKQMLITLLKAWKRADKRTKILYEDRLTDANFHSLCGTLCVDGYDKAMEWVEKEFA